MSEFTPFPVPRDPADVPLVRPGSVDVYGTKVGVYLCSGCGEPMPQGVWLHETVEDGMVTGLDAYMGPDGERVHSCGAEHPERPRWQRPGWVLPMSSGGG